MSSSRKAAIQAYKERKIARGIFAVRCAATGKVWVESTPDLSASENRTWFSLRHGDRFLDESVTADFNAHGRDAFSYEIVETLPDDVNPLALKDLLKERKLHWMQKLSARKLWPV